MASPGDRCEQLSRAAQPSSSAEQLSRAAQPSSSAEQLSRAAQPSSSAEQLSRAAQPSSSAALAADSSVVGADGPVDVEDRRRGGLAAVGAVEADADGPSVRGDGGVPA